MSMRNEINITSHEKQHGSDSQAVCVGKVPDDKLNTGLGFPNIYAYIFINHCPSHASLFSEEHHTWPLLEATPDQVLSFECLARIDYCFSQREGFSVSRNP